jgi:protein-tyrosine phosphatase
MPPADSFRILVVCTGNICRSPMAQAMLVDRLRQRLGAEGAQAFEVTSAGTHGLAGWEMEGDALRVLDELGVKADPFTARELLAEHVEDADLVLTATRDHRAAAVTLAPRASSRTFTLREFARLAAAVDASTVAADVADPVERARQLVSAAAGQRGYVRAEIVTDDDVADPYRRSAAAFQEAGAEIRAAVDAIVELLVPATAPA